MFVRRETLGSKPPASDVGEKNHLGVSEIRYTFKITEFYSEHADKPSRFGGFSPNNFQAKPFPTTFWSPKFNHMALCENRIPPMTSIGSCRREA